jgi:hypothetical protein
MENVQKPSNSKEVMLPSFGKQWETKCTYIPLPQSISIVLVTMDYLNQYVATLIWFVPKICTNINFVSMHLPQFLQYHHVDQFSYHPFDLYMVGDDLHMLVELYRCDVRSNDTA